MEEKFKFTTEFQWDLIRYILIDKNGNRALKKVKDTYFTLIEHQVIVFSIQNYYKRHHTIPGETMLREEISILLNSKKYVDLVTKPEQMEILRLVKPLYVGIVKDGDKIYELCKQFHSYTRFKDSIEEVDINDFQSYQKYIRNLQESLRDDDEKEIATENLLFSNINQRQLNRQLNKTVVPTPFKQINDLTSADGMEKGSIIVLLDKQKKGKTAALVNVARGYAKMKKNCLWIEFESSRNEILTRMEQSVMSLSKKDVLSGNFDKKIQRRFRKYKRLGSEIVVVRLMSLVDDANSIQDVIDEYYREHGIRFNVLIIDFVALMASISKKTDDTSRIFNAYLDLNNLVIKNDIDHCWTANHVTREAAKARMRTRYLSTDTAKAIDINRHVHAIYGLNRTEEEEEAGLQRMELVEQRDGKPSGRAVFKVDLDKQRMDELSINGRKEYDEMYINILESNIEKTQKSRSTDDL